MARRRYVSTAISTDGKLVKLQKYAGHFGPLLYTWMIPHAGDDCHITSDLGELQLMVIPGFKVKPEQVTDAVNYMVELDLLRQDERGYYFPPESFYEYQSYIPPAKRWHEGEQQPTPQNAEDHRESPQNAASPPPSLSPSPTPSPSVTPPPSPAPKNAEARERLKGKLTLTPEEWNELIAKHGSSVHARYWQWVDWIGEREGERMPTKTAFLAFRGFLERGMGRSKSSAATATR